MMKQIAEQVTTQQRFLVVAHESPDGDAIGSTLGLTLALREMGKQVTAVNVDGVPETLQYLPQSDLIERQLPADARFDVAFVLDAGEIRRCGIALECCSGCTVNIDHHPHSTFGDLRYVDTDASATAVLIYRLLQELDWPVSRAVAQALYLGILADTGSFRYASVNNEAFTVAARLIATGIDPWEAASQLYESYPPARMRLLGLVLPTLELSSCGRYASLSMTPTDLQRTGALEEHADGFVNYARAVRGVEVALFFNQLACGQIKVSLRSRGKIDVGTLTHQLGGGGHHNAAGMKLPGPLDEVKRVVYAKLDQLLSSTG